MARKVKVALFDKDLKAEIKKYPLNSDGTKIEIKQGGKGHFMPTIGNSTFIDIKRSRFLGGGYTKLYFAMKWSKKCVDFKTPEVFGPDPNEVMRAASNKILESKGKQKTETPLVIWLILAGVVVIVLKIFGVFA